MRGGRVEGGASARRKGFSNRDRRLAQSEMSRCLLASQISPSKSATMCNKVIIDGFFRSNALSSDLARLGDAGDSKRK